MYDNDNVVAMIFLRRSICDFFKSDEYFSENFVFFSFPPVREGRKRSVFLSKIFVVCV